MSAEAAKLSKNISRFGEQGFTGVWEQSRDGDRLGTFLGFDDWLGFWLSLEIAATQSFTHTAWSYG